LLFVESYVFDTTQNTFINQSNTRAMKALSLTIMFAVVVVSFQDAHAASRSLHAFPRIVFVSRNPLVEKLSGDLPGFGPQYRTAIVGGKLMVREKSGTLRTLVDSKKLIDVADPCVLWDGSRVLFSGVQHSDSSWRIFEINIDGSGFRQVSFSDRNIPLDQFGAAQELFVRYDDFDPCYLPEGKIVFASTRYPSMAMPAQVRTSNIYVMNADGTNMHRITSERSGAEEPTIDPVSGLIVYSRWWVNIDLPSNGTRNNLTRETHNALTTDIANVWHPIIIRPDGTQLKVYAGYFRTRYGLQTYKPSVMRDGRLLSTFSPLTWLTPTVGGTGIRWFSKGASFEHHVIGLKADENLRTQTEFIAPFATDPVELTSKQIAFSYSRDGNDYGIYVSDLSGNGLTKVVDLPGTLELEPQTAEVRPLPPVVKENMLSPVSDLPPTEDPETYGRNDYFRFDCMNIFTNGKVDEPMPDAPRIAQDLTIQFFMNSQRQNSVGPDPSILLKTAPVSYEGGVHESDVPAEVPLFEQIVTKDKKVLETTDGKFAHVAGLNFDRLGSGTKCVGCHIGHSMLEVPINGSLSEWFNVAPSASVSTSSELRDKNGTPYAGKKVVDRQARTGGDSVIWLANEGNGAYVELRWQIPIEARQFVLYGIMPSTDRKILVKDSKILLYYQGVEVSHVASTGALSSAGTSISIAPTKIDAVRIVITDVRGSYFHRNVAGIAEVETVARLFPKSISN
jgi:hypothetical protein